LQQPLFVLRKEKNHEGMVDVDTLSTPVIWHAEGVVILNLMTLTSWQTVK
jgi:hypothetical protein